MPEYLIVKRDWKDTQIKIVITDIEIRIEVPIDAFLDRLKQTILVNTKNLAFTFKKKSLDAAIIDGIDKGFNITIKEMKHETRRVVK